MYAFRVNSTRFLPFPLIPKHLFRCPHRTTEAWLPVRRAGLSSPSLVCRGPERNHFGETTSEANIIGAKAMFLNRPLQEPYFLPLYLACTANG